MNDNQNILPDLLRNNLKVVFCGTAAGNSSARKKYYYAHSTNNFYDTLFKVGFTDRLIKPYEYKELLNYNLGLTDLAKNVHGNDDVLLDSDFEIMNFSEKIKLFKPNILCFNGKAAASVFLFGKKSYTQKIDYGLLDKKFNNTQLFVVSSTSSAGRGYFNLEHWEELYELSLNS